MLTMKSFTRLSHGIGAAVLIIAAWTATGADVAPNSFGTWKMNSAQSKAESGADALTSYETTISDAGGGKIHAHATWVAKDGTKGSRDWTAAANGKAEPISGDPDVDAAKLTSKNPRTLHVSFMKGGKVVEWGRYTLSADGKTLHATEGSGYAKDAKPLYHLVFERE